MSLRSPRFLLLCWALGACAEGDESKPALDAGLDAATSPVLQDAASPGADAAVEDARALSDAARLDAGGAADGARANDAAERDDARPRQNDAGERRDADTPATRDAEPDAPSVPDAATPNGRDLLEPAQGALLGLFYGAGSIEATEAKVGRKIPLHLTYVAWNDNWPTQVADRDLKAGRIPFVNWEPFTPKLDDIIGGMHDSMLHARAQAAKALGKPFFLDFGAEMNGDWSPWGGAQNGMSAEKYVAAYRHIHDIFTGDGASNVVWAFCPNVTDEPRAAWNEALDYYPGDTYVDWMCVDGYNWGTSGGGGGWQSFQNVFSRIYPILAAKGKPIMIGEMASAEVGGNKAQWIDAIVPTLRDQYPRIKGLIWFDINKETDWRISSSPTAEQAFARMAKDPYFQP